MLRFFCGKNHGTLGTHSGWSGGDVRIVSMADDDYSYSFDDDFAEDERLGLSSICEENDKSSASYSFDDDFVSRTTLHHFMGKVTK